MAAHQQILDAVTALDPDASVYDPDNPDTWTLRDDGGTLYYSQISDGMGNRVAIAQATEAQQPNQITLSTGRKVQGRTAGDWRSLRGTFGAAISQPNTLLAVATRNATGTTAEIINDNPGSGRQIVRYGADGYQIAATTFLSGGADDATFHIIQANFNGASSEIFVDGSSVKSGNAGTGGLGGVGTMADGAGGNPMLDGGRVGPFIVFPGLQTNAATAKLRSILEAAYPIGLSG